jgi:predicted nucleic-acid-binding Zn-ribbon protein
VSDESEEFSPEPELERPPNEPKQWPSASERSRRINEKWILDAKCPICGVKEWLMGEFTRLPMQTQSDDEAGRSYPLVPVACGNCGYTVLFNAVVLGLAERSPGSP